MDYNFLDYFYAEERCFGVQGDFEFGPYDLMIILRYSPDFDTEIVQKWDVNEFENTPKFLTKVVSLIAEQTQAFFNWPKERKSIEEINELKQKIDSTIYDLESLKDKITKEYENGK